MRIFQAAMVMMVKGKDVRCQKFLSEVLQSIPKL